jgi:VIT1/CCC1 family predicted Fe2+/Mn2+ transporter
MLIVKTIVYFNPLRVFLPISALMFFLGFLVFLYTFFFIGRVMDITVLSLIISGIQMAVFGLLADLIVKRGQ